MQPRQGQGVFGFSRIDREKRREYVVVVNSSPGRYVTDIETFVPGRHGSSGSTAPPASSRPPPGAGGRLRLVAPGTSATVYRSVDRIPLSRTAPGITLDAPSPSTVDRSRMKVEADVAGDAYAEVTFQAKAAGEGWRRIGTDDNRPFRVFHDTAGYDPRTPVQYRAVVADNNGHARMSGVRRTEVPSPSIDVVNPAQGGDDHRARRRCCSRRRSTPSAPRSGCASSAASLGGDWESGRGGPVVAVVLRHRRGGARPRTLVEGDRLRYRAVLIEPGFPRVVSDTVILRIAVPEPAYDSVTVAGTHAAGAGMREGLAGRLRRHWT